MRLTVVCSRMRVGLHGALQAKLYAVDSSRRIYGCIRISFSAVSKFHDRVPRDCSSLRSRFAQVEI